MTTATIPTEAAGLVRRYYTYAGIYTLAASIIWGVNTLFLLSADLSLTEVFIANAAFSVGTVLFEIPTGVVADTIGRRASFLLSLVVLSSSTMLYVGLAQIGGGVIAFSIVSVFIGLGYTFYSGAMEAWLVDGVRHYGFEGDMDGIFATGQIVGGAAMLVGTVGGGLLGQIDLSIPFIVRSALLVVLFVLAFVGMHDVGFHARPVTIRTLPTEAKAIAVAGIRHGWRSRPLRLVMIAGAVQSGFFVWAWYAWQPYFLELLGNDAVWIAGVVAALLSLAMIAGNGLVKFFTRFCGRRTTILLWGVAVFAGASIGVGVASNFFVALGFLIVAAASIGVQMPVRSAFIHASVPSEQRATVLSFDSLISGVGSVGGQAGLGVFSDRRSLSAGYILGGAVTLVAVPLLWMARRHGSSSDFFEGSHTAERGGCVPTGIPAIASVDAALDA